MTLNTTLGFCIALLFFGFRPVGEHGHGKILQPNVMITFHNVVKGIPMVLDDSVYVNPFGEPYTIRKFRYYVSNIQFHFKGGVYKAPNSYHLLDQRKPASLDIALKIPVRQYESISFLVGVDSLRNVSGAQAGALDPLNDMFWTWNSGYVMAKMEGNSPASNLVNNMFEYHIGGYAGADKVLQKITITFPEGRLLNVRSAGSSKIIVNSDANAWWKGPNDIKISSNPGITSPGALAKKVSENYSHMFTLSSVDPKVK